MNRWLSGNEFACGASRGIYGFIKQMIEVIFHQDKWRRMILGEYFAELIGKV
jgi:hypothetical protein